MIPRKETAGFEMRACEGGGREVLVILNWEARKGSARSPRGGTGDHPCRREP